MNRIFFRALSLLLILFMLPMPTFAAEVGESVSVPNSGFEEADGDWVASWSHMTTEGAVFKQDKTKANTRQSSIYISAKEQVRPWAATTVSGLLPGGFYELSVFVNSSVSGSGAGIKLEFYGAGSSGPSTSIPASAIANSYPNGQYVENTNNRFVEHITIFHVPEGTTKTKIYLRLFGLGDAWFDDVTLKYSGGPEKYKFDTDKVFHYKEETGGDAFVTVDNFYKDGGVAEDTLVDFAVYYGETICEQAENVPVKDMEARYTYSTSYMTPYEKYVLKCKIKNRAGTVLEEHEQNLYVVDRPSMISEDGYLMVDGERFNPIVGYHVNIEDYPKAVEAGLNTVQISWGNSVVSNEGRNTTMAALEESGLKGIFCLYVKNENAGHPDVIENTKQIVEMMKDNDEILAFAIQDEPFLKGDDPDRRKWSEEAYLAIRKIDKTHPVYICDKRRDYISVKYSDILCLDSYAWGGNTQGVSRDAINTYAETKDKNKFWELAALYESSGTRPTMNDARNSIYRAFEEGATGMGYYSFSDAGGKGTEEAQLYKWDLWKDFCKFNLEEAPILFDRFVNGNAVVFNEYDDGGGIASLKWFNWFVGDDIYLVAHNRGEAAKTVEIPLESKNGRVKIENFTAQPLGLTTQRAAEGSGSITLSLGAEEIALFKIIPSTAVDLSQAISPPNLLEKYDPGFETGMMAEGVTLSSTAALATDGGHYSTKSVKLAEKSSYMQWDVRDLKPATNYTFSFWMKNSVANSLELSHKKNLFTVDGVDFATVVEENPEKYDWFITAHGWIGTYTFGVERQGEAREVWREVSVNFTTPYVDCNGVILTLQNIVADEYLRIDDVSLVETGKAPNRVFNGNLEALDNSAIEVKPTIETPYATTFENDDLSLKSEGGNHYVEFTDVASSNGRALRAANALVIKGSSLGKRYKVSFKYKSAEGNLPGIRIYNSGDTYIDKIAQFPAPEANEWETYTLYIDATDFINEGNTMTKAVWPGYFYKKTYGMCLDDIYVYFDQSRIDFYESLTFYDDGSGSRFFSGKVKTAVEGETPATYYFENDLSSEKSVEAKSLAALPADGDGYKTVTTRAHYLPVESPNGTFSAQSITLVSTVYRYENGEKMMVDIQITTGTSKDGQVLDVTDTVRVPENTETATYKVEAVAWNSAGGMKPVMHKAILE